MAENKKISELEKLVELTGYEMIPVAKDGKNYSITPKQIAPLVDVENLPTFDSITGQEKVIVVKDGKTQGLVTLTQIRQVVLPGYTFEDLTMDKFPDLPGGIDTNGNFIIDKTFRNEIPVKPGQVAVITLKSIDGISTASRFGFTTESLKGLENSSIINYANEEGKYNINVGETITLMVPDGATYLVINVVQKYGAASTSNCFWEIQIGELIDEKLDDLSERVNRLEQSAIAPASLDSVSRDEFDALKADLERLKSRI